MEVVVGDVVLPLVGHASSSVEVAVLRYEVGGHHGILRQPIAAERHLQRHLEASMRRTE